MNEKELIEDLRDCGALLEGHFILSSGLHSTQYLQCALALSNPTLAKKITKSLGKKIIFLPFNFVRKSCLPVSLKKI